MDLPPSFDYLKNVEIVLKEGALCSYYEVEVDGLGLGELTYDGADRQSGPWVFETDFFGQFYSAWLSDIAEALEALNALENGRTE